jgi:surface protein
MAYMFQGSQNLRTIYVTDLWDESNVPTTSTLFTGCEKLVGGNGTVYNSSYISRSYARIDTDRNPGYLTEFPNINMLELAFTSSSTDMFLSTTIQRGQIESINFSNTLSGHSLNDANTWDVGLIKNGTILAWATDTDNNSKYELTIGQVGGVIANIDSAYLFAYMNNLTNINLNNFDTSKVTNMSYMFEDSSRITSLNLSTFNTSRVIDMSSMFKGCSRLSAIYVSSLWNTSNVTSSNNMFQNCSQLVGGNGTTYDSSYLDKTYARIDVIGIPGYLTLLPNVNTLEPESATGATAYFLSTTIQRGQIESIHFIDTISGHSINDNNTWDVGTVKDGTILAWAVDSNNNNMYEITIGQNDGVVANKNSRFLFAYITSSVFSVNLNNLDTTNVVDMSYMFYNCQYIQNLNLDSFDTSNVTNMQYMFYNCLRLTNLDLSSFDTSNVTNMSYMFYSCQRVVTIYASSLWTISNVTSSTSMFYGCGSLVGGNGTTYSASYLDKTYARIDAVGTPGYLTAAN